MILDSGLRASLSTKGQPEEIKIITIYRLVSLLSISVFFFAGNSKHSILMKAFIIVCIGIASVILNYLYQRNLDILTNIKVLVLIETIGNSILLVPTGGLGSPFVWSSINTILMSAVMLGSLYCWINLCVYLFTATCMVYLIFENGGSRFFEFISTESNLILSLILITAIIRLLATYSKRLREDGMKQDEVNKQLNFANGKVRESINHIMELYQAVSMFTTLSDKEDMINTIMEYTRKVTKTDMVFFYNIAGNEKKLMVKSNITEKNIENALNLKIAELWDLVMNSTIPVEICTAGRSLLIAAVRSNCITYGMLGIEIKRDKLNAYYLEYMDQLKFMSGLGTIVFERLEMELVNERLVVTEEQNRIANEIHDSVLQRLFSTSFGIYGLIKNINNITDKDVVGELNIIRNSIDNAMKELREAIYSMSWNKGGADNFIVDTMNYIEETRRLNNIKISLKISGNSEMLSLMQKKSLYRIICEGIGNAVRHGSAENIEVILNIQEDAVILWINDDGTGFDLQLIKQSIQGGVGIKNIETLSHYLKGKACFSSSIGKGTRIKITFPIHAQLSREEKIV